MAALGSLQDNQKNSYTLVSDSGTQVAQRVKVVGTISVGSGGLLDGVVFDAIVASYPDSITEVYEYKLGGTGGTLNATVTVVYTDTTKEFISSVVKV